jgi:hypothetical protein
MLARLYEARRDAARGHREARRPGPGPRPRTNQEAAAGRGRRPWPRTIGSPRPAEPVAPERLEAEPGTTPCGAKITLTWVTPSSVATPLRPRAIASFRTTVSVYWGENEIGDRREGIDDKSSARIITAPTLFLFCTDGPKVGGKTQKPADASKLRWLVGGLLTKLSVELLGFRLMFCLGLRLPRIR